VIYNKDGCSVTVVVEREAAPQAADGEAAGETTADARAVTIQVADTGIGLTPEESAKLFQEFMRIKNEETYKILGSGLGLSTVRKLAQLYGGDATVKSEKGKGSIFTVTLHDADPGAAPAPAAAERT
jgi:signal transduction histidine kinase